MYQYIPPHPIEITLAGQDGFRLRQSTAEYINRNLNTRGAERGSKSEQSYGALAEIVIRSQLGLPEINPEDHPLGYDLLLPFGIKVDVKCRGGTLPFREDYQGNDGLPREAKHNFFARQLYDERLDADIYLMTHLLHPPKVELPGTARQRKWVLYVCGWVSKDRALREGVFLPAGSLTEQGNTWFTYRGQEIEFYNRNLNGLAQLSDLLNIEPADVDADRVRKGELNLTSVDAVRIAYDLVGRGLLDARDVDFIKRTNNINVTVKPIFHQNQYYHLLEWLVEQGQISPDKVDEFERLFERVKYTGVYQRAK